MIKRVFDKVREVDPRNTAARSNFNKHTVVANERSDLILVEYQIQIIQSRFDTTPSAVSLDQMAKLNLRNERRVQIRFVIVLADSFATKRRNKLESRH